MTDTEIYEKLTGIFREIFSDDSIVAHADMTANEVERWDSLSHIDMMLLVESTFGVRIPTRIITGIKNVGELVDYLKK